MGDSVIRVLLADDQALIRAGFRMLLDAKPDVRVVGEAANGADAVTLAAQTRGDGYPHARRSTRSYQLVVQVEPSHTTEPKIGGTSDRRTR